MSPAASPTLEGFAQFSPDIVGGRFTPLVQPDVALLTLHAPTDFLNVNGFVAAQLALADASCAPGYLVIDLTVPAAPGSALDLRPAIDASVAAGRAPVIRIALVDGALSAERLAMALASHLVIAGEQTHVIADWTDPSLRGAVIRRIGPGNYSTLPAGLERLDARAMLDHGLADEIAEHPIDAAMAYVRKNRRRHNGELFVYRSREHSMHADPETMRAHGAYWPFQNAMRAERALEILQEG